MCRIFGFRSILESGVHKSLLDADNAIIQQSDRHPDGWGVAYYHMGSPHLIKNDNQAKNCKIFEKVSGVVSSNTVVAHIRKSTVGSVGPLNTHPFQYGPWVFAHNGNVENFGKLKSDFLAEIDPHLGSFILGETDSEHLFYLLLTILKRKSCLDPSIRSFNFTEVVSEYIETFEKLAGPLSLSQGDYHKNYLTFVLTNGQSLLAFQGGQPLFYTTHKGQCSERQSCPFFSNVCEMPVQSGQKIHHLLVSSETIKNENIWSPLSFREYVGVDNQFQLQKKSL